GPLVHGRRRRRSAFVLLSVPFVTSGGTSAYGVRSRLGRQSTRPPRETAIYADRHARRLRLLNGGELKHRSAAACPQDLGDDRGDGAPARRTGAGAPLIKDERPGADLQSITAGNAGNKKIPNVRHKCEAYSPSLRRSSSPAAPERRQGVLARAPQASAPQLARSSHTTLAGDLLAFSPIRTRRKPKATAPGTHSPTQPLDNDSAICNVPRCRIVDGRIRRRRSRTRRAFDQRGVRAPRGRPETHNHKE